MQNGIQFLTHDYDGMPANSLHTLPLPHPNFCQHPPSQAAFFGEELPQTVMTREHDGIRWGRSTLDGPCVGVDAHLYLSSLSPLPPDLLS